MNDFDQAGWGLEKRGFDRLTPLTQALTALEAYCPKIAPEQMRIENAADRIAAAAIRAPAALPPGPVALCEGWAVAALDTLGASSYAPALASAVPLRVGVGDVLPESADAVLPLSCVSDGSYGLEILKAAFPGEGARAKGADFAEGEIIVGAGEWLRPFHLAVLRLAGIDEVSLRIPKLRILSQAGVDWVGAMAAGEGAQWRREAFDARDGEDLTKAMARPNADLLLVIGGVGSGHSVAQIASRSGQLLANGIAVRSAESIGCGVLPALSSQNPAPLIFVPERIECVLAAWLLLVRPCLRLLAGRVGADHGETLPLTRKITSNPGIGDLVLLRREMDASGSGLWEPLATGDLPWTAISRADAWLLVEPECEGYAAGRPVFARFL